jgi:adenosylmethionine-8-amino-7-oxononanoate aminotransferase
MPVVVRGEGVWIEDDAGRRYLDAMSGGSMAATLGHGRRDIIAAARAQAETLPFVHNERLTNPAQEALARALTEVAPDGFTRVKFTTSGADANEMAIQLARSYHVERGEPTRWQVISPAQAYHGPTMETLALTGRPGLQRPFEPYLPEHLHVPPSTWHTDRPARRRSRRSTKRSTQPVRTPSPSSSATDQRGGTARVHATGRFWRGLAERRDRHGFLVAFDEVVTGVGRVGEWFAGSSTVCSPDLIATAKGLGAGYAAIGAVLVHDRVSRAIEHGSGRFPLGHTWDGAPLPCAVGLRSSTCCVRGPDPSRARRGAALLEDLRGSLGGMPIVREVRGHGYLLGVSFVDPRDGRSLLPPELRVGGRIDAAAFEDGVDHALHAAHADGYAGDQTLFAPAFIATDEDLETWSQVRRRGPTRRGAGGRRARVGVRTSLTSAGGSRDLRSAPRVDPPTRGADAPRVRDAVAPRHGRIGRCAPHRPRGPDGRPGRVRPHRVARLGVRGVRRHETVRRARGGADVGGGPARRPGPGLCFGGQMLARVIGGEVYRSDDSEIGWLPVRSSDASLVPEGPWFQWHFDTFTLPRPRR